MQRALLVVAVLCGCKDDPLYVSQSVASDNEHGAVLTAAAELMTAGHTPAAYARFRDRLLALRPGMDEMIADEAERLAVTQAIDVVKQVPGAATGAEPLILTVWPLGLAPALTAPIPGERDKDHWGPWLPAAREDARVYLQRLCDGPLALDCGDIVAEGQATVVAGIAIERMTERARRAVSLCLTCAEPSWSARVEAWEALDRDATEASAAAKKRYVPARWPVAGDAGRPTSNGPLLSYDETGALELDGKPISPEDERGAEHVLRKARGAATTLRVHLPPKLPAERVRRAQAIAGKVGYSHVALIARQPSYPFAPREYRIGVTEKLPVKDGDPVQILLRVLDTKARRAAEKR